MWNTDFKEKNVCISVSRLFVLLIILTKHVIIG